MEIHAEYFLKCNEVAKWLNTPQPITGVPKEFLDGAHALAFTLTPVRSAPSPLPPSAAPSPVTPASSLASPRFGAEFARRGERGGGRKGRRPPGKALLDRDVRALERGFPELEQLGMSDMQSATKALLYVPVALHEHFVFGVALGCPVPPPDGVAADEWTPLVNRFVLDAGRKCCLMFSYFAEGSIVVSVDCFDEVGDHFSEVTFFEPTPVVGVFPRGIRGRMQIFEKRNCPRCAAADLSCACPVNNRIDAIVRERQQRKLAPEHGPAHAGSVFRDENVTIQTYPYWAQVLDEYKWSRTGSYCVQVRYSPARGGAPATGSLRMDGVGTGRASEPRNIAYRSSVVEEPRAIVDKMLRVSLFEKGVSALKPPATDVRWQTSSTVAVDSSNRVHDDSDSTNVVCFTDWHKLPGFQEDYLLVAPSNIVSGARARAELVRAEAERMAAREQSGVPVLPSWASGRAGVFEHILNESGPELEVFQEGTEAGENEPNFHARMLHSIPQASAYTEMRPPLHLGVANSGKRRSSGDSARRSGEGFWRRASVDSNGRGRRSADSSGRGRSSVETNVRVSTDSGWSSVSRGSGGWRESGELEGEVGFGHPRVLIESNRIGVKGKATGFVSPVGIMRR